MDQEPVSFSDVHFSIYTDFFYFYPSPSVGGSHYGGLGTSCHRTTSSEWLSAYQNDSIGTKLLDLPTYKTASRPFSILWALWPDLPDSLLQLRLSHRLNCCSQYLASLSSRPSLSSPENSPKSNPHSTARKNKVRWEVRRSTRSSVPRILLLGLGSKDLSPAARHHWARAAKNCYYAAAQGIQWGQKRRKARVAWGGNDGSEVTATTLWWIAPNCQYFSGIRPTYVRTCSYRLIHSSGVPPDESWLQSEG